MTLPIALIQLVSEQTMPNVLAALACRPAAQILLYTPRTQPQLEWIRAALAEAGASSDVQVDALSPSPDLGETGQAVLNAITWARHRSLAPVVNFTGGTKLMAIGAFAAAHREHIPSFYIDSEQGGLLPGGTGPLPPPLDSSTVALKRARDALTVSVITAAHGVRLVSTGRDPGKWLPLARILAADPAVEKATHDFAVTQLDEGKRRPEDYLRILQTRVDDLPEPLIHPLFEAGALTLRDGAWHLAFPSSDVLARCAAGERLDTVQDYFALVAPLQHVIAFLSGGWWELVVMDAAARSGRFRDLRWSCDSIRAGVFRPVEEDLLAVDGLSLAVFSCKRGGQGARLLRAFEELDSGARALGGSQARRFLCVSQPMGRHMGSEIRARAESTHTTLIGPAQRLSPEQFLQAQPVH